MLLKQHPDDYFTTYHVNQAITENPKRHDTPSLLWQRHKQTERFIRLAPLKRKEGDDLQQFPARSYLTLRFALDELALSREQIFELTHHLALALHDAKSIGFRRIDWINLEPARVVHWVRTYRAVAAIARWRRITKRKLEKLKAKDAQENLAVDMDIDETQTALPSPNRKRGRDDDEIAPVSKKTSLPLDFNSLEVA